jgi:hypothetical protein
MNRGYKTKCSQPSEQRGFRSCKIALEAVRLLLSVEADLKPDAASLARNGFERGRLDFAVTQPGSDLVHGLPEGGPSQLLFDMHDERRIERHIALLPMAHEAGAFFGGLSVGAASLAGRTNASHNLPFADPRL